MAHSTEQTAADVLRAARKLIERPECWTQGEWARTATGNPIGPLEIGAVCWCMGGAVRRAGLGADISYVWLAEDLMEKALGENVSIAKWNDRKRRSHKAVLRMFDRAIALAEAAQ